MVCTYSEAILIGGVGVVGVEGEGRGVGTGLYSVF